MHLIWLFWGHDGVFLKSVLFLKQGYVCSDLSHLDLYHTVLCLISGCLSKKSHILKLIWMTTLCLGLRIRHVIQVTSIQLSFWMYTFQWEDCCLIESLNQLLHCPLFHLLRNPIFSSLWVSQVKGWTKDNPKNLWLRNTPIIGDLINSRFVIKELSQYTTTSVLCYC